MDFALQNIQYQADASTLQNLAKVGIVIAEQDAHLYADIFGNLIKQVVIDIVARKPRIPQSSAAQLSAAS
ncbi:MAG: hypothetical protein WAM11_04710 [Cyanobium sp.]